MLRGQNAWGVWLAYTTASSVAKQPQREASFRFWARVRKKWKIFKLLTHTRGRPGGAGLTRALIVPGTHVRYASVPTSASELYPAPAAATGWVIQLATNPTRTRAGFVPSSDASERAVSCVRI